MKCAEERKGVEEVEIHSSFKDFCSELKQRNGVVLWGRGIKRLFNFEIGIIKAYPYTAGNDPVKNVRLMA